MTCSRLNLDHLRALAPNADLELVYHGLDLARFPPPHRGPGPDGSDPARPVRILTVARAVEKKGLDLLLAALARLPAGLSWRFEHLGGGPLADGLKRQAKGSGSRTAASGAAAPRRTRCWRRCGARTCSACRPG